MLLFGATKGFVSLMFSYFVGMESTLIIRANTLSIGVTGVPFYALWEIFPFLFTQGRSANPTSSLCQVAVTPPCFGLSTCRNIYGTSTSTFLWHHSMFLVAALHNYVGLPNMLSSFSMIERLSPLICFPVLNHFGSLHTCWVYWVTFRVRRLWCFCFCFRYFFTKPSPVSYILFFSVPPL